MRALQRMSAGTPKTHTYAAHTQHIRSTYASQTQEDARRRKKTQEDARRRKGELHSPHPDTPTPTKSQKSPCSKPSPQESKKPQNPEAKAPPK